MIFEYHGTIFLSLYTIFMNSHASCFEEYRTYIPHIIISLTRYITFVWPVSCFTTIIRCHCMYPKASITLPKTNLLPCQCILVLHSTSKWGKSSFDFRHHLLHQIVLIVQLYAHHDIFELMISLCVVKDVNKRVLQFNLNIFNYITLYKLIFGC